MIQLKKGLITTGGVLFVLFGVFHLFFWTLFDWANELQNLSVLNSNIIQMLNISLSFYFFAFAFVYLFKRNLLLTGALGKIVLYINAIFFFIRLILEFAFPEGSLFFGVFLLICALVYLLPAVLKDR